MKRFLIFLMIGVILLTGCNSIVPIQNEASVSTETSQLGSPALNYVPSASEVSSGDYEIIEPPTGLTEPEPPGGEYLCLDDWEGYILHGNLPETTAFINCSTKAFILENAEGQQLICENGYLYGDMPYFQFSLALSGYAGLDMCLHLTVPYSDYFIFTSEQNDADVIIHTDLYRGSSVGQNAQSVLVSNDGITVYGENMKLACTFQQKNQAADPLYTEGTAADQVSIIYDSGQYTVEGFSGTVGLASCYFRPDTLVEYTFDGSVTFTIEQAIPMMVTTDSE